MKKRERLRLRGVDEQPWPHVEGEEGERAEVSVGKSKKRKQGVRGSLGLERRKRTCEGLMGAG